MRHFLPTTFALLLALTACAASADAPLAAAESAAAPTADQAEPPAAGSVGKFDRNKVFATYWRQLQHSESIREFNEDFRALRGAEEPEEMTLRRIRIQRAGRELNSRFEADLRQALQSVAVRNRVFVVVSGEPLYRAPQVRTVDLTEPLTAELSVAPAPEPAAQE